MWAVKCNENVIRHIGVQNQTYRSSSLASLCRRMEGQIIVLRPVRLPTLILGKRSRQAESIRDESECLLALSVLIL